jgi:hypothetical protein
MIILKQASNAILAHTRGQGALLLVRRQRTNSSTHFGAGARTRTAATTRFQWFSSTETNTQKPPVNNEPEDDDDDEVKKKKRSRWRIRLSERIQKAILRSGITDDADLSRIVASTATFGIYGLAAMSLLGTLGIDTKPMIAGVGITGFTVGFALKEIAGNFLSGMLLVLSKPFSKGQYVKVQITASTIIEGTVESIDARYTYIRAEDNRMHMVPSSLVYSSALLVGPAAKKNKTDKMQC